MLKLDKPTLSFRTVYSDCLGVIRDRVLRAKLNACTSLIQDAEKEFEDKITRGEIFTIVRENVVNSNVTAAELKNVYTVQMVGNPAGRVHYDKLILAAPFGLCPYCAHRDVSTLDHYLPKAEYPRLSIVPINLVPSCKDCNTGKRNAFPTTPQEETLHPYYDDIENEQWLKASVNRTSPVSVSFSIEKQSLWSDLLFQRVENHFLSYNLKVLYAVQAARELSDIKSLLIDNYDSGAGAEGVGKTLHDNARSRFSNNKNSWRTALYEGLANDIWFCAGGFRQIGQ